MTAVRRPRQPFFVIGTGRCGSTLLCHLLQAHPSVAMMNEARLLDALWFFFQFARLPAVNLQPASLHEVVDQALSLYDGLFSAVRLERHFAQRNRTVGAPRTGSRRSSLF